MSAACKGGDRSPNNSPSPIVLMSMQTFRWTSSAASAACLALWLLWGASGTAEAGLAGQPALSAAAAARIRAESGNVLKGEIATGRPNLFLAIQANATADFTDLVARVIGDDTSYNGIVSTLEEARQSAKTDADRQFLLYNLARVHLLRSLLIRQGFDRRPALDAAADTASQFATGTTDPAVGELKGDIAAERGDVPGALAGYKEMLDNGAPAAQFKYKTGWAYERANRTALASGAYNAAALAQATSGAGGAQLKHLIYQGLTRVAVSQGDYSAALRALAKSASVGHDDTAPFKYRLDAASRLLQHGYAKEVLAYANAALAASPGDADATLLRDQAAAAGRGR